MAIRTTRLKSSEAEPHTLEVDGQFPGASALLWHLSRLSGVKVVAHKSWVLTDDFEAYFVYKGRLFVMETPLVNVWISLVGQPEDEALFAELEKHVQSYNCWRSLFPLLLPFRYLFTPFNPPRELLLKHGAVIAPPSGRGD
jgi:hypothetical protein